MMRDVRRQVFDLGREFADLDMDDFPPLPNIPSFGDIKEGLTDIKEDILDVHYFLNSNTTQANMTRMGMSVVNMAAIMSLQVVAPPIAMIFITAQVYNYMLFVDDPWFDAVVNAGYSPEAVASRKADNY